MSFLLPWSQHSPEEFRCHLNNHTDHHGYTDRKFSEEQVCAVVRTRERGT